LPAPQAVHSSTAAVIFWDRGMLSKWMSTLILTNEEGKRVASYFSIVRRSVQAVFDENELDTVENGIWNDCFQTVVSDSQCRIQHISALFFSWKHCREDSKYRHMVNEQPLFHY